MAPELRKKKSQVTDTAEPQAIKKAVPSKKRKATEEVSSTKIPKKVKPVDAKKEKKSKPTQDETPRKKDKAAKGKKSTKAEETTEERALVVRDNDAEEEIEWSESDSETQQLAAAIDSGDDAAPKDASLFKPGQDVGLIPEPMTNREKKARKKAAKALAAAGEDEDDGPGVVYVGRIPHGFYEHEMRQYFSQFGAVRRLRLSRNKKTGASKHFAFVEFASAATADIVARTMDNYLLFGHVLKCQVVPPEKVQADLWKGANRRFKAVPRAKMERAQLKRPLTQAGWEKRVERELGRRQKRAEKLKAIGYEFEAPGMQEVPPALEQPVENAGLVESA